MAWLGATYQPEGKVPLPILINLDLVRCVRRTDDGRARIVWNHGTPTHTQILCEDYEDVVALIFRALP